MSRPPDRAAQVVEDLLSTLAECRAEIRHLDRLEHPPITDRFGRVWTWRSGDFYVHDDALCFPRDWILGENGSPPIGLPSARLADNPNYTLCDICRSQWEETV